MNCFDSGQSTDFLRPDVFAFLNFMYGASANIGVALQRTHQTTAGNATGLPNIKHTHTNKQTDCSKAGSAPAEMDAVLYRLNNSQFTAHRAHHPQAKLATWRQSTYVEVALGTETLPASTSEATTQTCTLKLEFATNQYDTSLLNTEYNRMMSKPHPRELSAHSHKSDHQLASLESE